MLQELSAIKWNIYEGLKHRREYGQGFFTTSLSWKHVPRTYDPWVRNTQGPLRKPSFEHTIYDNVGDQFNHLNRSGGNSLQLIQFVDL